MQFLLTVMSSLTPLQLLLAFVVSLPTFIDFYRLLKLKIQLDVTEILIKKEIFNSIKSIGSPKLNFLAILAKLTRIE